MIRFTFTLLGVVALVALTGCSKEAPTESAEESAPEPAAAPPPKQVKWEMPWKEKEEAPPPMDENGEPKKSPEEIQKEKIVALIEEYKEMKASLKKLQDSAKGVDLSYSSGLGGDSGMKKRQEQRKKMREMTLQIKKMRYKIEGEKVTLRKMLKAKGKSRR